VIDSLGREYILMMPNEDHEEEFPESIVDEMLDDDYGPDNSDEEDEEE
jgi:hypothetical protein